MAAANVKKRYVFLDSGLFYYVSGSQPTISVGPLKPEVQGYLYKLTARGVRHRKRNPLALDTGITLYRLGFRV